MTEQEQNEIIAELNDLLQIKETRYIAETRSLKNLEQALEDERINEIRIHKCALTDEQFIEVCKKIYQLIDENIKKKEAEKQHRINQLKRKLGIKNIVS